MISSFATRQWPASLKNNVSIPLLAKSLTATGLSSGEAIKSPRVDLACSITSTEAEVAFDGQFSICLAIRQTVHPRLVVNFDQISGVGSRCVYDADAVVPQFRHVALQG